MTVMSMRSPAFTVKITRNLALDMISFKKAKILNNFHKHLTIFSFLIILSVVTRLKGFLL